ncbi:Serine/threonine-protein kinase haspin [Mactra antiquata]
MLSSIKQQLYIPCSCEKGHNSVNVLDSVSHQEADLSKQLNKMKFGNERNTPTVRNIDVKWTNQIAEFIKGKQIERAAGLSLHTTMGKDRVLCTYGRHRNRVVVADSWLSDSDQNVKKSVFSSSLFDDSSKQCFSMISNTSEDVSTHSPMVTRSNKKSKNKENVNSRPTYSRKKSRLATKDKSSEGSDSSLENQSSVQTRALRNRRKIDYNDSANSKKQLRGTTAKRKRQVKVKLDDKKETSAVNFSDFDSYSFIVSNSPLCDGGNITHLKDVETSTPVAKRTCKLNPNRLKVGDISHIEVIPSPSTDVREQDFVHQDSEFNSSTDNVDVSEELHVDDNHHDDDGDDAVADDDSDHDEDSDGNDEEDDDDSVVDESKIGELSAILESEEESESVDNDYDEETEEYENSVYNETGEGTEDMNDCCVKLDRLSRSLLLNHVNVRDKKLCKDIEDISIGVKNIQTDSNSTLYMINEDFTASLFSTQSLSLNDDDDNDDDEDDEDGSVDDGEEDSDVDDDDSEIVDDEVESSKSNYETADEGEVCMETPKKKYSLRGKFQELQNSFSDILTPSRRRSNHVPLSARARVFVMCDQTEPISFSTALPNKMLQKCKKIGDGVYGEVFRSCNSSNETVAIKIIPIEGDFEVNDEPQKKFAEILPEIVIAKELSDLRYNKAYETSNFCKVNSVSCVKGRYPDSLIKQWDLFYKSKGSENDRPDVFPDKQLYIMFEFADCGTELEAYQFESIHQAKSVITQVAYALAVAEESLQFEHRDLHWGNILIKPTQLEDISFKVMGKQIIVPTFGVEANIIDFTLSRLTKDGCTVFTNLANDDSLFTGKGDYQFDVYREMKKQLKNKWDNFCPSTNVLWLNYLGDKLVYMKKYPSQSSRKVREVIRQFRQFLSQILEYHSASELVLDSIFLNS